MDPSWKPFAVTYTNFSLTLNSFEKSPNFGYPRAPSFFSVSRLSLHSQTTSSWVHSLLDWRKSGAVLRHFWVSQVRVSMLHKAILPSARHFFTRHHCSKAKPSAPPRPPTPAPAQLSHNSFPGHCPSIPQTQSYHVWQNQWSSVD